MNKDKVFFNITKEVASMSNCVSVHVGAIVVKDNRILSTGYNGTPAGYHNCDEIFKQRGSDHTEWSNKHEIHAEMNALLFAAKNGRPLNDAVMYTLIQPCFQCSKNIIQSGIKEVVYLEDYYQHSRLDHKELIAFFKDNGVAYRRFNETDKS